MTLEELSTRFLGCNFIKRRKILAVVAHKEQQYEVTNYRVEDNQIILVLKEIK